MNEQEYNAFKNREEEISNEERIKIVLKSLITLAYVSLCVTNLRQHTKLKNLYHLPLMLTLVNKVNTDVKDEKNDLWAFFQTLRKIATGEIDELLFKESKSELINDWENSQFLFGGDGIGIIEINETSIKKMKIPDLHEAVFLSRRKGALQFIRSHDNKELAFQMKNSDNYPRTLEEAKKLYQQYLEVSEIYELLIFQREVDIEVQPPSPENPLTTNTICIK